MSWPILIYPAARMKKMAGCGDLLEAGIDVITAVNIQHIESINEDVKDITGVEVTERVPDKLLQMADEVVNIDLTADELITRLKEGKIYDHSKVQQALQNFSSLKRSYNYVSWR